MRLVCMFNYTAVRGSRTIAADGGGILAVTDGADRLRGGGSVFGNRTRDRPALCTKPVGQPGRATLRVI